MVEHDRIVQGDPAARADPIDLTPPYDLEADMLFAITAVRAADLAQHFPSTRFVRVAGSIPLLVWFGRVRSAVHGPPGERRRLDATTGFGYDELTVVAAARGRRLFVPVIYTTDELSLRLGHRYGMPKRSVPVAFRADEHGVTSTLASCGGRSEARARLLASGRVLAKAFDVPAPWWTWRVGFPSGTSIRARVLRVPRAQLAHVSGALALDEPWLREPLRLRPLGVFVPGLVMRLPAPAE
jgi:hypothetical protein